MTLTKDFTVRSQKVGLLHEKTIHTLQAQGSPLWQGGKASAGVEHELISAEVSRNWTHRRNHRVSSSSLRESSVQRAHFPGSRQAGLTAQGPS